MADDVLTHAEAVALGLEPPDSAPGTLASGLRDDAARAVEPVDVPPLTAEEARALGLEVDPQDDPGALATGITAAAQVPALGFVDELAGAFGAKTRAQEDALARLRGQKVTPFTEALVSDYRGFRDAARRQQKAGEEAHPMASKIGTGVGILLSALSPLPVGNLKAAAGMGAAGGLGTSEADLTRGEVGEALGDTAVGAGVGALAHGVAKGAGKLGQAVAGPLRNLAIRAGRRVLTGGADLLGANRAAISPEAVEQALKERAIRLFGTTEGAAKRLEALREAAGDTYGKLLETLEKAGVEGPDALALGDKLATAGRRAAAEGSSAIGDLYEKKAMEILDLPSKGKEFGLSKGGDKLGLTQGEKLKRALQREAKYGRFEETPLNEAKRDIASTIRQAVEDTVEPFEKTPGDVGQAARDFVPVKQRLGRLIEAETAADKGAAQASKRQPFSLKDWLISLAMGGGDPIKAGAVALGSSILRNRLGSTAAAGLYGGARALEQGARSGAEVTTRTLGPSAAADRLRTLAELLRQRGQLGEAVATEE